MISPIFPKFHAGWYYLFRNFRLSHASFFFFIPTKHIQPRLPNQTNAAMPTQSCPDVFSLPITDAHKMIQDISNHNAFGGSSQSMKSAMVLCDDQEDSTMLTSSESTYIFDLYEPDRRCTAMGPPKRFYRTFWRSITRRALQRAKESIISDVKSDFCME